MITICLTYYKSLNLTNLAAALYSVWRQDLARVDSIILFDNDTDDAPQTIQHLVETMEFPIETRILSMKHQDANKTHSWSTNAAVEKATSPWVFFTRADYILDFDILDRFCDVVDAKPEGWDGFVTADVYHLVVDVVGCERAKWREYGPSALRELPGAEAHYSKIDSGVWMARKASFDRVGGLDESLTVWGHAQTDFQYRMHEAGVEFVRIPEVLFYHPQHAGERDLDLAHRQLKERGKDLKELWKRHEGPQVY